MSQGKSDKQKKDETEFARMNRIITIRPVYRDKLGDSIIGSCASCGHPMEGYTFNGILEHSDCLEKRLAKYGST